MPVLDWIFVAVLVVSLVVGAWRGLVYELLSVANWIAAFVLAQWFAPDVAQWLPLAGASEVVRYAVGFVAVFVASLFAGGLLAFLIRKLVAAVGLRPVDRVLGCPRSDRPLCSQGRADPTVGWTRSRQGVGCPAAGSPGPGRQ